MAACPTPRRPLRDEGLRLRSYRVAWLSHAHAHARATGHTSPLSTRLERPLSAGEGVGDPPALGWGQVSHAASGETTFCGFVGSTTPLARALEAGPPARMVTAAGRADRYPSRTRRLRTEQVARRPQLPRSFVAQHAEKPLCRFGACPDVYSCSLKTVDQSILKDGCVRL